MKIHKTLSLLLLCISIWACNSTLLTNDKSIDKKTILFVCEHGAGRSAVAASYFNKIANNGSLKIFEMCHQVHCLYNYLSNKVNLFNGQKIAV